MSKYIEMLKSMKENTQEKAPQIRTGKSNHFDVGHFDGALNVAYKKRFLKAAEDIITQGRKKGFTEDEAREYLLYIISLET